MVAPETGSGQSNAGRRVLVLAAHGAGDDSPANARMRAIAAAVAAGCGGIEVRTAFNLGQPDYHSVLADLADAAVDVTVVPVMTSDGYFRRIVLARALAEYPAAAQRLSVTPALGDHPRIGEVVLAVTRTALTRLSSAAVHIVVIGHGTERNPHSSRSTYAAVETLRRAACGATVQAAFLDEPPRVEDVTADLTAGPLVLVPFLIGGGGHTLVDIPERVGFALPAEAVFPVLARRGEQPIVMAAPLADHPLFVELVLDAAHEACARQITT